MPKWQNTDFATFKLFCIDEFQRSLSIPSSKAKLIENL
jgi:hypothetical protein